MQVVGVEELVLEVALILVASGLLLLPHYAFLDLLEDVYVEIL